MSRSRPSPLWLFFFGRRRRGFPWLLVGVLLLPALLALTYLIPAGVWWSHWMGLAFVIAIVVLTSIALGLAAGSRRRGRR